MFWEGFLFLSARCFASRLEKGAWHQRRKCGMVLRSHGKIAWCLGLAPGKPESPAQTCLRRLPPPPPPHTQLWALTSALCHSHPGVPSRIPDPADSLSCRAQGPSCLPALPRRLPARVLLPPPCSAGFLPSPAGMGLGFTLQPCFWSRNPGCWAPLGDTLPPPGWHRAPGISSCWALPPSSLSHVRHQHCLETFPFLSLRSFTSHQGLVRMWLRHQQPGPCPVQTAQCKQLSSGHGASPSPGILWEPFPNSWSCPWSLSSLTAIPSRSAGLMELGAEGARG